MTGPSPRTDSVDRCYVIDMFCFGPRTHARAGAIGAQIVVRAGSFPEARSRAMRALAELRLVGPGTNRKTLERVLGSSEFATHTFTTALLGQWLDAAAADPSPPPSSHSAEVGSDQDVLEAVLCWPGAVDRVVADARRLHIQSVSWAGQRAAVENPTAVQTLVKNAVAAQLGASAAVAELVVETATGSVHLHVIGWNPARAVAAVVANGGLSLVPTQNSFALAAVQRRADAHEPASTSTKSDGGLASHRCVPD